MSLPKGQSGNPYGPHPREFKRRLRAMFDKHLPEFFNVLKGIALDETKDDEIRIKAIKELYDRSYGRPSCEAPQKIELTTTVVEAPRVRFIKPGELPSPESPTAGKAAD